jgi:hypothetical protein
MRGSVEADRWIAHQAESAAAPDWNQATALLRGVRALGYPGGYSVLRQHLARRDPWPAIASIARRPNTEVCQHFWRKSSRILLCPAASLVISALPMKAEPFAEPNPDQDLAAASDAPGIPGIC